MKVLVALTVALMAVLACASIANAFEAKEVMEMMELGKGFLNDAMAKMDDGVAARFGVLPTILLLIVWPVIFIVVMILLCLP